MELMDTKKTAHREVRRWNFDGRTVGFVPTMGALHEGHLSLVRASLKECDRTAVSIFVNPTQFGEGEDLDRYPRSCNQDIQLLEKAGVDLVFVPPAEEMYPSGFCTWVVQRGLTEKLCGASRPGHFRGVCTVVAKLFGIIPADKAYFGRKDFQQAVVIRRMAADLDMAVKIRVMPVVRERDGLALSSRNRYLTPQQRSHALCLHRALFECRRRFRQGVEDAAILRKTMWRILKNDRLVEPEYAEVVTPEGLERPQKASPALIAAVAAHAGGTRLIDNVPLGGETGDVYLE